MQNFNKLLIALAIGFLSTFSNHISAQIQFNTPQDISNGAVRGVSSLDVGDLNGDGLGDVVVVEGGKHAGGRKSFVWYEAPSSIQGSWTRHSFGNDSQLRSFLGAAKIADIDNDNDLDLIVSSDNHSGGSKQADIYVYINPGPTLVTGNWSFQRVTPTTLSLHHINDMEIEDLDGDNKKDIVVRSLEPNQIHIFFQNSVSSYTQKVINTNIVDSEGLAVGYIDGDALPDITFTGHLLKSPADPRTQDYLLLDIDANYKTVNQNTKEAIGDIDGDGLNDVLIAPAESFRNGGNTALSWYKNPGNITATSWQQNVIVTSTNNTHTVKLADMDNDGDLDVITGVPWSNSVVSVAIRIYYNNGSGSFSSPQVVVSGKGLYSGAISDVDGDGDLDIIGQDTYARNSRPYVYESEASLLPIELTSFSANIYKNRNVLIEWTTTSEVNNSFFTIERSKDLESWEQVKKIDGQGNSSSLKNYAEIDNNPYSRSSYYRLKQTDFNGSFSYSDIQTVSLEPIINLAVYPNPANERIIIETDEYFGNSMLELRDTQGRLILVESIVASKQAVTLSGIEKGIYFLTLTTPKKVIATKLIIL